ncbi:MAG: substrate-binding domain-containing protein [Candidatus Heimdallarchaeota archaeon]|nr:substrate-binding domain-containing protein [Candidatus Heimdallarchaeota archaeon]
MKNPRKKTLPFGLIVLILFASIATLDINRRSMLGEFETDKIEFEMLYSSEKAGWLEAIAPIFEEEWKENYSTEIKLILNPIGSGKGTLQVARSISKPIIWSPASRFWLSTLNYLWQLENPEPIVDTEAPALVVSPTVIATWKSYQTEHNISSLDDLRDLALHDPSFTYAHTDPSRSNSGFGGVIMQVATAIGKNPEDISLEDLALDEVHQWMRDIESAAIEYGSSTGFLAKMLLNGGPSQLKVALLYENLIVEKNRGIEAYGYNDSLVAIYPSEGTVLNDHPYGILDAPWVTDDDRDHAQIFLDFLKRPDIQEMAVEVGFRPTIDNIHPSVEASVFNESVGVLPTLDSIKIYDIGNIDGEVLQRIPDLWLATRAIDVGDAGDVSSGLETKDYLIPSILLALMLVMILYPIISMVRNYLNRRRF